jgi:hypothetical protein
VPNATGQVQRLSGPSTLPALLRLLGVDREPATRQRDAITTWLADDAPSQELLVSLYAKRLRPAAEIAQFSPFCVTPAIVRTSRNKPNLRFDRLA